MTFAKQRRVGPFREPSSRPKLSGNCNIRVWGMLKEIVDDVFEIVSSVFGPEKLHPRRGCFSVDRF
jgi:hypothetical protein